MLSINERINEKSANDRRKISQTDWRIQNDKLQCNEDIREEIGIACINTIKTTK
jgi:hypothetical protein